MKIKGELSNHRHAGLVPASAAPRAPHASPMRNGRPRHKHVLSDAAGGVEGAGVTAGVRCIT